MEEITNSKKRKREIRNEKLRKARQAKFEKRQRVEKISQFRRIADCKTKRDREWRRYRSLDASQIAKQLEEGNV